MATLTIMDPVTRIEGHMKVAVTVEQNRISDARCTGTLFRGFETILQGRHPWDAPVITQRICGVCPISHGQAAVLALDDAAGVQIPANARVLRNLTLGANFIQSHILHFYLLAALDYVQGPQVSPFAPAWNVDMRGGLSPVVDHLVGPAIEARRRAHEMGAVFGGKMPASHAFIPGGFTAAPTAQLVDQFRGHLDWLIDFIRNIYIPDVVTLADTYADHFSFGSGCRNLLAYGVFPLFDNQSDKLLRPGYITEESMRPKADFTTADITESVACSWYDDATSGMRPDMGETTPVFPKADAYSWLKSPRLSGIPFEVGPLARMWVNGDYMNGISVMDRHMARANETLKIAEAMNIWLNEVQPGGAVWEDYAPPTHGLGIGMTEAPRGALGHWVKIGNGTIERYQIITPTCWNASPKDGNGQNGPMEQALIGTPVSDPQRPIEALRVIHSFDPCLSCAVHVMQPKERPLSIQAGLGNGLV